VVAQARTREKVRPTSCTGDHTHIVLITVAATGHRRSSTTAGNELERYHVSSTSSGDDARTIEERYRESTDRAVQDCEGRSCFERRC